MEIQQSGITNEICTLSNYQETPLSLCLSQGKKIWQKQDAMKLTDREAQAKDR